MRFTKHGVKCDRCGDLQETDGFKERGEPGTSWTTLSGYGGSIEFDLCDPCSDALKGWLALEGGPYAKACAEARPRARTAVQRTLRSEAKKKDQPES